MEGDAKKLCGTGQYQKCTFIRCRRLFALHLLENGADLKDIQTMMGHADISSTQVYVQLLDSHFKKVYHNCHPRVKV